MLTVNDYFVNLFLNPKKYTSKETSNKTAIETPTAIPMVFVDDFFCGVRLEGCDAGGNADVGARLDAGADAGVKLLPAETVME